MRLKDGFTDVPTGKIATIVTHLEMRYPPTLFDNTPNTQWELKRINHPSAAWYKALFTYLGKDWLWFSRLTLDDEHLGTIIQNPLVQVYVLNYAGKEEGLLELDFRIPKECELTFIGVSQKLQGQGAGRFLLDHAIKTAWSQNIERFHLHTCTMDHPGALPFYMRNGFVPYKRQVEIAHDPRLKKILPEDVAPHMPIIRPL